MADYSADFTTAFSHAMLYEVGPWFNPYDPDVIAGRIDTPDHQRKCGYGNIPGDSGGVTKYGISQHNNPAVNVAALTLAQAQDIYFSSYWRTSCCDQLIGAVTIMHFDCAVNNGVGRACKFLQAAAGVTVDGQVGPATITAVTTMDQASLIQKLSMTRSNYYNRIVQMDPSQAKFLAGWLRRVTEVTQYTLAQLPQS